MSISNKDRTAPSPQRTSLLPPLADTHATNEGRLAYLDHALRAALARSIKESRLSRYQLAGAISELLDRDCSKDMLDKYTAESAAGHHIPAEALAAFALAAGDCRPLDVLAEAARCVLVPLAEPARHELPREVQRGLLAIVRELGEAAQAIEQSLRDDRLTTSEATRCRKELMDLIRTAVAVHRHLDML